jgi:hypothetical protein
MVLSICFGRINAGTNIFCPKPGEGVPLLFWREPRMDKGFFVSKITMVDDQEQI